MSAGQETCCRQFAREGDDPHSASPAVASAWYGQVLKRTIRIPSTLLDRASAGFWTYTGSKSHDSDRGLAFRLRNIDQGEFIVRKIKETPGCFGARVSVQNAPNCALQARGLRQGYAPGGHPSLIGGNRERSHSKSSAVKAFFPCSQSKPKAMPMVRNKDRGADPFP